MSKIKGIISIKLQSDLCPGSGYSFAGIVDSDVCYDDCGIPYIPAKRIKGCMREVLENVLYAKYPDSSLANKLFGARGASDYDQQDSGKLVIGNAYPKYYEMLHKYLSTKESAGFSPEQILNRFTHVVGQTQIKGGVADNQTLRYTRVVNQYSPLYDPKNPAKQVFEATVSYQEEDKDVLSDILKALRGLGLKRNRGMGVVECSLSETKETDNNRQFNIAINNLIIPEDYSIVSFVLENNDPLVLCSVDESTSESFISGQSMLGLMAGRYLRSGRTAQSQGFNDLFLNGKTIFTNIYPCNGEKVLYPAPDYLCRLKKTKKYVFTHGSELPKLEEKDDYYPYHGNQPKKLRGKFVALDSSEVSVCEVTKDIVFHNRHESSKGAGDGKLYGIEAIRRKQLFAGAIIVQNKYKELIEELLATGDFYFGKSRSSQYGHCSLFKNTDKDIKLPLDKMEYKAGDYLLITFLSDSIFLNEIGEYTVYKEEIKTAVEKALGLTGKCDQWTDEDQYISSIQTCLVTGYLGTWNLRKYPVPAIKAGSYLVLKLKNDFNPDKSFIGERTLEGYGMIRFDRADTFEYKASQFFKESKAVADISEKEKAVTPQIQNLLVPVIINEWLESRIQDAIDHSKEYGLSKISNTAISRWKMMVMESFEKTATPEKALDDFFSRINSIKKASAKEEAMNLYNLVEKENTDKSLINKEKDSLKYWEKLKTLGFSDDQIRTLMRARWGDFITAILVNRKYEGGE